jgi:hypothetical protein
MMKTAQLHKSNSLIMNKTDTAPSEREFKSVLVLSTYYAIIFSLSSAEVAGATEMSTGATAGVFVLLTLTS